jgi:hypothetical protein
MARTAGGATAPSIATPLIGIPGLAGLPFLIAGVTKVAYDLILYRLFVGLRPPEERQDGADGDGAMRGVD